MAKPNFSWREDEEFLAFLMEAHGDSREEVLTYVSGMEHSYKAFKAGQRSVVRVGTAAFIRDADGRVLMGKRKGSHGPHTWCVPGGHVDFGEEPSQSVRREILEETGLGQAVHHALLQRRVHRRAAQDHGAREV